MVQMVSDRVERRMKSEELGWGLYAKRVAGFP